MGAWEAKVSALITLPNLEAGTNHSHFGRLTSVKAKMKSSREIIVLECITISRESLQAFRREQRRELYY